MVKLYRASWWQRQCQVEGHSKRRWLQLHKLLVVGSSTASACCKTAGSRSEERQIVSHSDMESAKILPESRFGVLSVWCCVSDKHGPPDAA